MRRPGRFQRLALAAGAAASVSLHGASAAEPAGSLRATLSAGGDSNARRVYEPTSPDDADVVASLLLEAAGRAGVGPVDASGSYVGAARKFFRLPTQDTLAQEGAAELGVRPLNTVQLAVNGRAKDRRGGPRRYSDLQTAAALRWRAVPELEVELHGGAHRFVDWVVFGYSFSSPEAGARVRFRFDRSHTLTLGGDMAHRRYNAPQLFQSPPPDPPELLREDGVLTATAGYAYRGPFQLSVGYQYVDDESNSYGETSRFHRVDLAFGTALPWELLLFAQLTVQFGDYPEGISLGEQRRLTEDDERQNAFSLKLVRPLSDRFDLELRYGAYSSALTVNALDYFRQVAWVGVTFRL